jgi:hypothetical protein
MMTAAERLTSWVTVWQAQGRAKCIARVYDGHGPHDLTVADIVEVLAGYSLAHAELDLLRAKHEELSESFDAAVGELADLRYDRPANADEPSDDDIDLTDDDEVVDAVEYAPGVWASPLVGYDWIDDAIDVELTERRRYADLQSLTRGGPHV